MARGLWGAAQVALILYLDAFTAAAEVLTECGGSTGHAYVFASPLITPGTEGWTEDRLSGGRILLTIDQGEADIIYRDVTGMRSAKGDGAEIMIAGGNADQGTTLVLLFYPTHGIVEHYLFQIDSTGKDAVSWGSAKPSGPIIRDSLFSAECSPP